MPRCIVCRQVSDEVRTKSSRCVTEAACRRGQDELAFLPAALEIVETPPSPLGRAIGVTIIAMFCVALVWACFGHIDIVATATGKIVPSGRTKVVQPFETGVVRAIHVQDGQTVKAGEVLIELDPTINEAERNHLRGDLATVQLDIARLQGGAGRRSRSGGGVPPAGRRRTGRWSRCSGNC